MSDTNDYLQEAAVRIGNLEDENAELRQRVEAAEYNFGVEHDALVLTESQRDALSAVVSQLKAHIENAPSNLADTNARLTVQLVEARERIDALAAALLVADILRANWQAAEQRASQWRELAQEYFNKHHEPSEVSGTIPSKCYCMICEKARKMGLGVSPRK